jgi:hypothetical protein
MVPGRSQCSAAQVHRAFARVFGWSRFIKEPLARGVQIAEAIGLKPVCQNPKHEVARQVRGRATRERIVPAGTKAGNIEIAQVRDLDIESFLVWRGRTNLHTRHVQSGCSALRLPRVRWAFDAVDTNAVDFLRIEFQLQLVAHDSGEEAAH